MAEEVSSEAGEMSRACSEESDISEFMLVPDTRFPFMEACGRGVTQGENPMNVSGG